MPRTFKFQIDFLHFFVLQMFWISKREKCEQDKLQRNRRKCVFSFASSCCPSTFSFQLVRVHMRVALMIAAPKNIILPLADLSRRAVDESVESRLKSGASFKNHYSDLSQSHNRHVVETTSLPSNTKNVMRRWRLPWMEMEAEADGESWRLHDVYKWKRRLGGIIADHCDRFVGSIG